MSKLLAPFTHSSSTLHLPTITVTGDQHITIEQHYQLISFYPTEIKLQTSQGLTQILGENLIIKRMYPYEIILSGSIKAIHFHP